MRQTKGGKAPEFDAPSATGEPLGIAATSVMPAAAGDQCSPIVEAVAGAVSEVNATNFTIARSIATTPVPAAALSPDAEAQPAASPQLASAVATMPFKAIKPDNAPPVKSADPASSDDAPQPPSPSAMPPGAAEAKPHSSNNANAGAAPASPPLDADRSQGDPAAPAAGGHHAGTTTSQPQPAAPDALFQPGVNVNVPTPQPPTITATPAAQLTATAATNFAVPVAGLAVEIAASARAGNSRFEIRLDPAELGRIDVRLDVDRHGNVASHLTVEKPETLAMLRQDTQQLQRALEDAGLKTGQNGLQFSLRDQSSNNPSGGDAERQPRRLVIHDADTAPLAAVNATYMHAAGASRGLDIRV